MADTIVFIHGNFVTRRTWEPWVARYSARGYKVVSIAYPGRDKPVKTLKANPTDAEPPLCVTPSMPGAPWLRSAPAVFGGGAGSRVRWRGWDVAYPTGGRIAAVEYSFRRATHDTQAS